MSSNFQSLINTIYNKIGDDVSRDIYANRLMYSLTGDTTFLHRFVELSSEGKLLFQGLNNGRKKVVFGAGAWGKDFISTYRNIEVDCFVDNKVKADDTNVEYMGYPVVSFAKYVEEYKDTHDVIITTRLYYREIFAQLIEAGVKEDHIINVGKMTDDLSKRQYFDNEQILANLGDRECFVDAGAFDGVTSSIFAGLNDKAKVIYAFEPDENNAKKCEQRLQEVSESGDLEYHVIKNALWNQKEELRFAPVSNGTSCVSSEGEVIVYADRMDDMIPQQEQVTFIKMDLEGAEYKALEGAAEIIKRCKPKMAISIYHKPEDMWELPELILSYHPDYTFYLGHYSVSAAETVLYCVP